MSREIQGKLGVIEGVYKTTTSAPLVAKPCEHVIIQKGRTLRKDIVVIIHGKDDGESSITEHVIGSDEQK